MSYVKKLGFQHTTLIWGHEDMTGNLSANAREARYKLMKKSLPLNSILMTGHTLDDQVETFLMRLRRGSGVDGLASMTEQSYLLLDDTKMTLFRPLLEFERQTMRDVLNHKKLS